jgi:transglutaminase-like putative cysteine protease
MAALARLGPDALDAAGKRRDAIFMQQGITFEVAGSDGERRDHAWPLDLVPRVLTSEWTTIKRGLAQSTWEALSDPGYREAGGEFLLQTDDAPGDPRLQELVATTGAAATPLATVMLVSELIADRFEYRQGATYVDSEIADLLKAGAGVCQDFVHLGLCLLRHHGIAARYVSGYLFAGGSDDGHESIEVDTHAWLEALLPVGGPDQVSEPVWVGADPINRVLAGETHVKIGHGRHYADVPPIKGVYRGAATAKLDASVTMTRLERTDPASIARS